MVNFFPAVLILASALTLTFFAIKQGTSKPYSTLAGILGGFLFLALGVQMLPTGITFPTGWTEGNDTITYGYRNFTERVDTYTCPDTYELNETNPDECVKRSGTGVVNSTESVQLTYYKPFMANETSSYLPSTITYATQLDTLTQAVSILFMLLGLATSFLSVFSMIEKPRSENEDD